MTGGSRDRIGRRTLVHAISAATTMDADLVAARIAVLRDLHRAIGRGG
jgi:hypothetical protein